MCQKCGGNCGLWVLYEIHNLIKYAENMKKIVGAVWELPANPANFHSNWTGLAVLF